MTAAPKVRILRAVCGRKTLQQGNLGEKGHRAIKGRGASPSDLAMPKCLYLVTRSLDPTGVNAQSTLDSTSGNTP